MRLSQDMYKNVRARVKSSLVGCTESSLSVEGGCLGELLTIMKITTKMIMPD